MITVEEIRDKVRAILDCRHDFEQAHAKEDDLYHQFIKHVAESCQDADFRWMAKEVLKTKEIDFHRVTS